MGELALNDRVGNAGHGPRDGAMQSLPLQRLALARRLLSESDVGLAQTSARTGFASQAHMTTLFRRELGTTPRQYRAAFRKRDE